MPTSSDVPGSDVPRSDVHRSGATDRPKLHGSAVQSVDRALTILDLLATEGAMGVTEIAGLLSIHKSTASRLLATLEAHGLAEQVPDRGRYRLGVGVLRLAGATRARLDLVQESRPVTHVLAAELGETVNVVILAGRETLYLDQVSGTSALQIHNWVGARNPVHATANGRVLLAGLGPGERDALLAGLLGPDGALPRLTDRTVTAPDALSSVLAEIADAGYAIARDELEIGLTAIAAPIRGVDGTVIASLSASGPTFRLADRLNVVARAVVVAAAEVSRRMGFHGSPPADGNIR